MGQGEVTNSKQHFVFICLADREEYFGPAVKIDAPALGGYVLKELTNSEEDLNLYFKAADFAMSYTENMPKTDSVIGMICISKSLRNAALKIIGRTVYPSSSSLSLIRRERISLAPFSSIHIMPITLSVFGIFSV